MYDLETFYTKAEQGEGKDHSIIYLNGNGKLVRYIAGNWNWRANNRGNVHVGVISKRHNQIGVINKEYCKNLAVFPNHNIGREALIDLLNTFYLDDSIETLAKKYAPKSDHNDPATYAEHLRRATGIYNDTPVRDFTADQFQKLLAGIEHEEGREIGEVIDMYIISKVHKKGNEIYEYFIDELGWISKEQCIEYTKKHKLDTYVVKSKDNNLYVRARIDSSFQIEFEKIIEKNK